MAKRKARSDSIDATVIASKSREIEPLAHCTLRESDWPFWYSIVRARIQKNWTDVDLENAANLARCKSDIERLQIDIEREGDVIENQRGTPIVNPKHSLIETLTRRAMALSKMLHVHAEATVGRSRNEARENSKPQPSKKEGDDLLAKPRH